MPFSAGRSCGAWVTAVSMDAETGCARFDGLAIAVLQNDEGNAMMHKHQMPDAKRMSQHHPSSVRQKLPGQYLLKRGKAAALQQMHCAVERSGKYLLQLRKP